MAVDLDARVRDPSSVVYTRGGKLNALLGRMIVSGLYCYHPCFSFFVVKLFSVFFVKSRFGIERQRTFSHFL